MCEAKPGPRCSSDTKKAYRAAHAVLEEASIKLAEIEAKMITSTEEVKDSYQEEWTDAVGDFNKAKQRAHEAELDYNATPDGIASLTNLVKTAGEAVTTERIAIDDPRPYNEISYDYYDGAPPLRIAVKANKKEALQHSLKLAQQQREWQGKMKKILDEAEPARAQYIAESFRGELYREVEGIREKFFLSQEFLNEAALNYARDESPANEKAMASKILEKKAAADQITYLRARMSDLDAFQETNKKKI